MNTTDEHIRHGRRPALIALAVFLVLTIIQTGPVLLDIDGTMYGYPGDTFDHVWMNWWHKYSYLNDLDRQQAYLIDAPVGKDLGNMPLQPTWRWTGLAISLLTDEIVAFNILSIATFFLSGATMFFLTGYVTKSFAGALVAGIAYMLCPYHLWHSYSHLTLAAIQWMPLYALCLMRLHDKKTVARAVLCGSAFALVVLENYWYGMFMGIFTIVFVLVALAGPALTGPARAGRPAKNKSRPLLRAGCCALALAVAAAAILPFTWNIIRRSAAGEDLLWPAVNYYERTEAEAHNFAARPIDYLRPSTDHPLWRKFLPVRPFAHEWTIYIGMSVLVFAIWGFAQAIRKAVSRFAAVLFLAGAVAAVLLSMDLSVSTVHKIFPMFRVHVRFGILAMMCLCVLAAFGVRSLCAGFRTRAGYAAAIVAVSLVVAADFANCPPWHYTKIDDVPQVYVWLAGQEGDFIVTELPGSRYSNRDRFFGRLHKKRLLSNDRYDQLADLDEYEEVRRLRAKGPHFSSAARSCEAALLDRWALRLSAYGVKYLIVHPGEMFSDNPILNTFVVGLREFPDTLSPAKIEALDGGRNFRHVKSFDDVTVYEVLPRPARVFIVSPKHGGIVAGSNSLTTNSGRFIFDIFLRREQGHGSAVGTKIKFRCGSALEGENIRGENGEYTLEVSLSEFETFVEIAVAGAEQCATIEDLRVEDTGK